MILWKCCTQYASKFGKLSSGPKTGKGQFSFQTPKKGNAKECSNYHTVALFSHASKVCSKFSKPGFNSKWTMTFRMFKLVLEKAEEPKIKSPTSVESSKKRIPEKHLLYWLCQSHWLCRSQQTVENSERDGNTRPPYLPPEKSICRSWRNS